MQRGQPSLNPAGRGAPITKAKAAPGSDGVASYGGYLAPSTLTPALTGSAKWTSYASAYRHPAVAIALLLRYALLRGVKWQLTPNPAGGDLAELGVDITQRGLIDARMPKPWTNIVPKAAMAWANGFSLHATSMGRRADGLVTYTDIAHRPAHTIEEWHRRDPQRPFDRVTQRISGGRSYNIDLAGCLYIVNDALTDAPDGMGVLALVADRLRKIDLYESREGTEIFSSMGGTPIARVPMAEIEEGSRTAPEADRAAWRARMLGPIEGIVRDRVKRPELLQYAVMDSATFESSDGSPSGIKKWDIEIVKGDLQGLTDIRGIIASMHLDVARVLGVEWVFMGSDGGAFAMHADKTNMFAATLQGDLNAIASSADDQLVRPLMLANGLDPDLAAPILMPGRITGSDVEKAARTLGLIQTAGLPPNHPAKRALYETLELPWMDEDGLLADMMLPRRAPEVRDDAMDDTEPVDGDATEDTEEKDIE